MTNREFYKTQEESQSAFLTFCDPNKCNFCHVRMTLPSGLLETVFCKERWLDLPAQEESVESMLAKDEASRHHGIYSKQCPQCKKWEPHPFSAIKKGSCHAWVNPSVDGKIPDKCVWFKSRDENDAQIPIDVACVHRGGSIDGPDLYLCNHPANLRGTRCDYKDVRDCFLSGKIRLTPDVPAPDAPAPYVSVRVPEFVPTLTDAFETLERKAYYRGLLAGLNEAKRHLQISAAVNTKTAEGHCLRGDAAYKLNEVNELIEAAQKECDK